MLEGGSALDAKTITVKTRENPYRGSRGERFGLLKNGMTVAQYAAAAEHKGYKRDRIVSGLRLFERDKPHHAESRAPGVGAHKWHQ